MKNQTSAARAVAYMAHRGQTRNDGITPYFTHPEAVAKSLEMYCDEIVEIAYLHDCLEDSALSASELREIGFSEHVICAVMTLTHLKGDSYESYIGKVKENSVARLVKIADIQHNLSSNPSSRKREIYIRALDFLQNK
jgi:(p)ppGpp synthase/HD superfamily hydrolase